MQLHYALHHMQEDRGLDSPWVTGNFHWLIPLDRTMGSDRNEYKRYLVGVKPAGA
jgi:hypothetical protein